MNWSFLIAFGIGLGAYFIVLGIIVLVKYIRNKKKLEKEIKEQDGQIEEVQKQDTDNQTTGL